jgi:hypothetical protein
MTDRLQKKILLYIGLIMIGIILLAAGLPALELKSGAPLPGVESIQETSVTNLVPSLPETRLLLKFPLAAVFILVAVLIMIYLLKNLQFKKILLLAGLLLLIGSLFYLIDQIQLSSATTSVMVTQTNESVVSGTPYEFSPVGQPPQNLFTFIAIGLCIAAAAAITLLFFQSPRKAQKRGLLAEKADLALNAIRSGEDLGDLIIRCYLQMEAIVKEEKGIQRSESLTPREFEEQLAENGIPEEQIQQLTRLFEKARYSNRESDFEERQLAIACLSSIIQSCGGKL